MPFTRAKSSLGLILAAGFIAVGYTQASTRTRDTHHIYTVFLSFFLRLLAPSSLSRKPTPSKLETQSPLQRLRPTTT